MTIQHESASGHGGAERTASRVVGVGLSTGGLPALARLVRGLGADTGLGYVIVYADSGLSDRELIAAVQPHTGLPVAVAADGVRVQPDRIYLSPTAQDLEIVERTLRLAPATIRERAPIDRFFRTLGRALGRDAVGIVLSGAGADGTIGLKLIKEVGGLTVAQDPDDAEADSMPRAAVAGGLVDLVVPADRMAERVLAIVHDAETQALALEEGRRASDAIAETLRDVLTLLRIRTGHDFSQYKRATLLRRIERRMQVCQVRTIVHYLEYLRDRPDELPSLLRDFLISVTNFFRDPETFAAIERDVIPRLFAGRGPEDQVRIWVPGCATGEEAYSLAILAAEHAARLSDPPKVQLFATDIDEQALRDARAGRYLASVASDLGAARVERFFAREGTHLRINKNLREMVLFSPHNLLRDPPFSRLDLVTCRNLLIYLDRDAQERVLGIAHFGLRPDGLLVLGSSESAENAQMLFAAIDARHRIYVRRPAAAAVQPSSLSPAPHWPRVAAAPAANSERSSSFGDLHHKIVELYAPPSILVNEHLDIVHLSEHAGRYLQVVGGEPTRDLLRLIVPALHLDLRAAIYAARHSSRHTDIRRVRLEVNGESRDVQLTVTALDTPDAARGLLLITFGEGELAPAAIIPITGDRPRIEPAVRQLEDELNRTRDQLRATVEQYEVSVEELRASNEELQAINEELRAATEELETSKEELQSVNEELITLNHELGDKIEEVSRANSDLQNLMTSTDIGVLFLDRALHIKRFTPRAQELFNVIASDLGRPFAHLTHRLETEELVADAARVRDTMIPIDREVDSRDGRRYLVQFRPYRALDNRVDGVVLAFLNISELSRTEAALRAREQMLRLAERAAEAGMWELDASTDRLHMSEQGYRLFGFDEGTPLMLGDWLERVSAGDRARVGTAIRRATERRDEIDLEFEIDQPRGRRRLWMLGKADQVGHRVAIAGITVDVTERRVTEAALRASEERFRVALRTAPVVMLTQDHDLRYVWGFLQGGEIDFVGKRDEDLFDADQAATLTALKRAVLDGGVGRRAEVALTLGSRTYHYDYCVEPLLVGTQISGVRVVAVDITSSKLAELSLRENDRRKDEFIAILAHELRNPLAPLRAGLDLQRVAGDDLRQIHRAREAMDRQVAQLVHLVDDLLEVSRITEGKIELRREPIDIRTFIDAAVEATAPQLDKHGHHVELVLPDQPIVITADLTRMTQILSNVIGNASKYTRQPSTITLTAARVGAELELRVRDRGIGISEAMLPHVFELFSQSPGARERTDGGLGIGLHLVRRLVELHGGTVTAQSAGVDQGSEFVITLPLEAGVGVAARSQPRAEPGAPRLRRVLVVDDNHDVAETICELLVALGCEVATAFTGETAVATAAGETPELVLLDIGLPDLSGYEVARRLRTLPGGATMKIIAISGWGQPDDIARSAAAGIDRHLVKPVTLTQLREILGDLSAGAALRAR